MDGNGKLLLAIFVSIFVILMIAFAKSFHKDSSVTPKYDERQMAVRGRGYMFAFYIIILVMALMPVLITDEMKTFLGDLVYFIPLCVGLPVHVMYCVWNNAYVELNLNVKAWIRVMLVIGLFNLLLGGYRLVEGTLVEDGVLQANVINLYLGILVMVIIIELLIKNAIDRKEAEEDEESEA